MLLYHNLPLAITNPVGHPSSIPSDADMSRTELLLSSNPGAA